MARQGTDSHGRLGKTWHGKVGPGADGMGKACLGMGPHGTARIGRHETDL